MIHHSRADKTVLAAIYVFLVFCLLIVAYPLLFVINSSFSDPAAVAAGKVWLWPIRPTLKAYRTVLTYRNLLVGFSNSLFYMVTGTVFHLVLTMMAAFPLSRREFYGRNIFTLIFATTMYFSGGLVPTYLLVNNLGLLDTRAVMIIPGLVSVWHVIMCRTYLQSSIPDELFEAAQLDGCGEFRYMCMVAVPLSAPILAVLALYTGVGIWNSYFDAMIYLTRQELFPLQIVLRSILLFSQIDLTMLEEAEAVQQLLGLSNLMKYAVIVVASLPVMLIYPFVQRFFVRGVMVGSIKG